MVSPLHSRVYAVWSDPYVVSVDIHLCIMQFHQQLYRRSSVDSSFTRKENVTTLVLVEEHDELDG